MQWLNSWKDYEIQKFFESLKKFESMDDSGYEIMNTDELMRFNKVFKEENFNTRELKEIANRMTKFAEKNKFDSFLNYYYEYDDITNYYDVGMNWYPWKESDAHQVESSNINLAFSDQGGHFITDIFVSKYQDEWFILSFNDIEKGLNFKCDELTGLLECLEQAFLITLKK